MTYPLIGNYGTNSEDEESYQPHVRGLIVGENARTYSSWRSQRSLKDYLTEHGILGIDQVDTRAVTLHIRSKGAMKCRITTESTGHVEEVLKAVQADESLVGRDLISEVTTHTPFTWPKNGNSGSGHRIAVIDCGVKYNQLRLLAERGCQVKVFPSYSNAQDVLAFKPRGLFVSNGPGDPAGASRTIQLVKELIQRAIPTFGICFGHQLISLALGAKTFKLKFGHRGANQPVQECSTGRVEITSQNHGFCVDKETLDPNEIVTTHINLNDGTSEGLRHKRLPLFSVQYHPEACPGPHDSTHLFDTFLDMIG